MGVPEDDCRLAADVLILADLRGVDSHGVSNMLRSYIRDYRQGKINPTPKWRVLRESASAASLEADAGLGLIIAPKAMDMAIEKAKKTGIGMVTMRNAGHMGMASYYAMQALPHDMIGLAMTSSPPEMVPTFGAEARLGTNPIALAAPALTEAPFVYDAATTVISSNKIKLARRLGVKLPGGWIAGSDGTPVMEEADPNISYDGRPRPYLLPLGSIRESGSHKGYGLAGVVEILSGILTGGGFSAMPRSGYTHAVAAYRIESFMDTGEFKKTMDDWLRLLRTTRPAPGHERVYYPGQMEAESEKENRAKGIPLHREVIDWFRETCGELSIQFSLKKN